MQMIDCPNCQKRTGFKRALGVGTFLMVLLTFGLWLFVIPFYPARCITCGLPRNEALPPWRQAPLIIVAGIALVSFVALVTGSKKQQPELAPIVKGPQYNELPVAAPVVAEPTPSPVVLAPAPAPAPQSTPESLPQSASASIANSEDSDSHTFKDDGRVYSVALLATSAHQIALGTRIFAQGRLSNVATAGVKTGPNTVHFGPLAFLQDQEYSLICSMPYEDPEVAYRIGQVVQMSGEFSGMYEKSPGDTPILLHCQLLPAITNVIRPAERPW